MAQRTYLGRFVVYLKGVSTGSSASLATLAGYFPAGAWRVTSGGFRSNGNTGSLYNTGITSATTVYFSCTTVSSAGEPGFIYYYQSSISDIYSVRFQGITIKAMTTATQSLWCNGTIVNGGTNGTSNPSDGAYCHYNASSTGAWSAYTTPQYYYYFKPQLYQNGSIIGSTNGYKGELYRSGTFTGNTVLSSVYKTTSKNVTEYLDDDYKLTGLTSSYYYLSAATIYSPLTTCNGYYGVSASTSSIQYNIPFYVLYQYQYVVNTRDYTTNETMKPVAVKDSRFNTTWATGNTVLTKTLKPYSNTTGMVYTTQPTNTGGYTAWTGNSLTVYVSGNTLHKYYNGIRFSDTATTTVNGYVNVTQPATKEIVLYRPYYYQYTFKYDNTYLVNNRVRIVFDRQIYPGNPCYIQDTTNGQLIVPTVSSTTINYTAYTSCAPMITGTTLASSTQMPVLIN